MNIYRKLRQIAGLIWRVTILFTEVIMDAWVFFKASAVSVPLFKDNRQSHRESDIIRMAHVIEKGLSMVEFRPRFGEGLIRQLHLFLKEWNTPITQPIASAWFVLQEYVERHQLLGIDISDILELPLSSPRGCESGARGGVKAYQLVEPNDQSALVRGIKSRVSVRQFQLQMPNQMIIERAVRTAMSAPSVCNRQTCKVRCYPAERGQALLSLQNGNRGFGHTIPLVLVITTDLRQFTGSSERNQGWIDGGMFAMTLLLGLHAECLGAVALNWSVLNGQDRKMHTLAEIPPHERIIMLIGCGHPLKDAKVPVSCRRDLDEVLHWM